MAKGSENPFPSVLFDEQASDIATPAADRWVLYTKSGGVYARNAAGTVVGPFAAGAASAPSYARKTADQTSTSTAFADVTGLTFAVSANTNYRFRFVVFVVTSAAAEGYALSVNGPAGTYKIGGILPTVSGAPTGNQPLVGSGAVADTTGLTVSTGPAAPSLAIVEGVALIGGAGGTLALRVKAETGGANSVTIQANSYGEISAIA